MKRFTLTAFIVLMILSFMVTVAGAQTQPPVQPGTTDEDGELVLETVPSLGVDAFINAGKPAAPGTEITNGDPPLPSTPMNDIYTKYPDFICTELIGATKYKVEVWDNFTNLLVYTLTGSGNCTSGYCKLKPTLPLKNYVITDNKGYYRWRVAAKVGTWQPFSGTMLFSVYSTGFNSSFTTSAKWLTVTGPWSTVSPGYLKTGGEVHTVSSVIQREWFAVNYVYEVKMKRSSEPTSPNLLYFQGYPDPLDSVNYWYQGYVFQYTNEGKWMLFKAVEGSTTIITGWNNSSIINPEGWNKLTVMRDYPYIDLWINGQYVGFATDTTFKYGGFVGIGMVRQFEQKSPLLVDSAKLYYTNSYPYPSATLADGQHDPAFELQPPADPGGVSIDTSTP